MTSGPRIVAVTAHRPHELAEPLGHVEETAAVVHIETDGFLRRNVAAVRDTRRAILDTDPDVVVSDSRELLGLLTALVCLVYRVPFVFRFKGDNWESLALDYRRGDGGPRPWLVYRLNLLLDEGIYAISTGFVVVSEDLKRVVVDRLGCSPDRVAVVHVPVDTTLGPGDAAAARERFGIDESFVFLTVANLKWEGKYEGLRTAVEGLRPVLEAHEEAAYVVAGGGSYLGALESFVDREVTDPSVRERIYTLGHVGGVEDLYAVADVFVYISHIDGYPKVVLEAQQAGLPAIVNAEFGMVEQVSHGESGYLLREGRPEELTRWAEALVASEPDRRRLGEAASERARTENDPAVIGRKLVTALESVLTADGARR